ncbi:MAG: molybdopterin molybdotransferase MoeA [Candidatus Latescibacteria bacterium]|jgi:molybdopterin molybdotransferase|nr:molybdopterin molybdotransferase MoeA [Candidatus Latescibacterota bacterium]
MIPIEEAIRSVLDHTQAVDVTAVDLVDALGRTLAEDVRSDVNMPPFDKAMMDGYAVLAADVATASPEAPAVLDIVEEIPAGAMPTRSLSVGEASRIMTGAPMPEGAETVVMVEDTADTPDGNQVQIFAAYGNGKNVGRLAEDVRIGQVVLEAGSLVRPPEIGIMAAVGAVRVPVYRQPTVGVVATGDEIIEPGTRPEGGQIRNSNGYSMAAQIQAAGARALYLGISEDREEVLRDTIARGLEACDILLLSGGVSAGLYDLVQGAMRDCGVEILFDRLRMKPGKPLTFGAKGQKLVFGLPGNPVSTVVGLELMVRPAIRKMQKMGDLHRPAAKGSLVETFRQRPGRKQFVPAWSEAQDGRWQTRWVGHHGSADLFALANANSLFVIEAEAEVVEAGSEVDIILLTEW